MKKEGLNYINYIFNIGLRNENKNSLVKLFETFDNPERVSSTPEGDELTYCRLNKGVLFIPDGRVVSNAHERDLLADNY